MERSVKLHRDGKSQTVTIPPEFALPGEDAVMRKDGDTLTIKPAKSKKRLLDLLAKLEPLEEEFPEIPELPLDPPPEFD